MISVTMAYYNRPDELRRSISAYKKLYSGFELSICDDRSEPSIHTDFPEAVSFDTVIHRVDSDHTLPLNPCVPLNIAVNQSKHDIIVLTNPEIEHREDVFTSMMELLDKNSYVTARCVDDRGVLAGKEVDYSTDGRLPVPEGAHFHFCAMLCRELWEKAGGFDEDYRFGQACEDNDWLWRLHRVGAEFKHTEKTVYHHQTHVKWNLPHNKDLFYRKWPSLISA